MRLRQRDLKEYTLKRRVPKQDIDGTTYQDYDSGVNIKANISPAGGKTMSDMYGERLKYMLTMLYDGSLEINELDGICVYVSSDKKPDYRVAGIMPWNHSIVHLEKVQ